MKKLFLLSLLVFSFCVQSAQVKSIEVPSTAYQKPMKVTIVLPDSYESGKKRYQQVYLLHGAGGHEKTWTHDIPGQVPQSLADKYQLIMICPTGGRLSWYTDHENNPVETYLIKELIPYIDQNYRTINNRWLTGLSMGGYGSLKLGLKYPKLFSGYVGQSPCIEPGNWQNRWGLGHALGPADQRKSLLQQEQFMVYRKDRRPFGLIIGTEDFFYKEAKAAHERLKSAKVRHWWHEMPGAHNGKFWAQSLPLAIDFLVTASGYKVAK